MKTEYREGFSNVSNAAGGVAVAATALGQPEIAVPAGLISTAAGLGEAVLSDNPGTAVAVEVVTSVTGTKTIGGTAKLVKDVAGDSLSKGAKNLIDAVSEAGQQELSEKMGQLYNEAVNMYQ